MHLVDLIVSCSGWAWHTTLTVLPVMALLLLLGRWRSFPASWRLVLAGVVAVRLLMPMVPAIAWHPWQSGNHKVEVRNDEVAAALGADLGVVTSQVTSAPADNVKPVAKRISLSSIMAIVWLLGVVLTALWVMASHLRLRSLIVGKGQPASEEVRSTLTWSRKRMGLRNSVPVLQVTGLPTMALWGWLTPRVLVPHDVTERYSQAEMRGMLLHELAHLRRRDGLWIWLGLAVCALHWFNPLVWLCLRRYLADRELECDRAALDHLPEPDRITYGHALLKTLAGNTGWSFATCTPFARSTPTTELKHRITMIAKPLNSRWGRTAALLTVPLLAIGTLTTAADEDGKKPAAEEGKEGTRKPGEREGEGSAKKGPRDGEGTKTGARDGEGGPAKKGTRDGEGGAKKGPRDGEGGSKTGARDGEGGPAKKGPRDGEGGPAKKGARDGEGGSKTGPRDGDEGSAKKGPREGDGAVKKGPRDGEGTKTGAREGEGSGKKSAEREGGEGKGAAPATAASGQQMVIQVNGEGNVVNSKGEVIDIKMVRGRMKEIADENPNQNVVLRAAADTPYAKVLNVLDALKDAGLKDVKMEQAQ